MEALIGMVRSRSRSARGRRGTVQVRNLGECQELRDRQRTAFGRETGKATGKVCALGRM